MSTPGTVIDTLQLALRHEPVAAEHEPSSGTTTAATELFEFTGLEVGVWEMSAGEMRDIEADEVFVVVRGRGTVEFLEPQLPAIELQPGSLVRLAEGMRTRWSVTEPLRKVYLA